MASSADRILACFQQRIAALNVEKGSADDARPEEKRMAQEMFDLVVKTVQPKKKSLNLTQREKLGLVVDFWEDYGVDSEFDDEDDYYSREVDSGLPHSFKNIIEDAKKIKDLAIREEVEILVHELEKLVNRQYSLAKADAENDRLVRLYLETSETERLERKQRLELIEKRRKQIHDLILILMPEEPEEMSSGSTEASPAKESTPDKTPTSTETSTPAAETSADTLPDACKVERAPTPVPMTTADPAETSAQLVEIHSEAKAESSHTEVSKVEISLTAVPVATADPAKTSAQSVEAHPEAKAASTYSDDCVNKRPSRRMEFDDFLDDSDFDDFYYAESMTESMTLSIPSPTPTPDREEPAKQPTVAPQVTQAGQAKNSGKFSFGLPQPSEKALPMFFGPQPQYQSTMGLRYNPLQPSTMGNNLGGTPKPWSPLAKPFPPHRAPPAQRPYPQWSPFFAPMPGPQSITEGSYAPYGSGGPLPPYPNQPAQNPGPWYNGGSFYPIPWTYPNYS